MIRDISTIKIQGANFISPTLLSLFEPRDGKDKQGNDLFKTVKGTLLYGRNGTGKSTIAKAFRKAKGDVVPAIKQVSFVDKDGKAVVLSDEDKKCVFVFDEDYVNEKVKLKEDHLDTIIMLGHAADLAGKIEQAEKDRDTAKILYDSKDAAFKEYKDSSNPKSPKNRLWRIGDALRGDDAWAGRDRRINGGRQNSQVRDDTYKKFVELNPLRSRSDLIVEFEEKMQALTTAKSGASKIEINVPKLPNSYNRFDDETIIELLAKTIEKPDLSEREQYLLGLVESGKADELLQKAAFFRNPSIKECPYCYQSINDEYKSNLVSSIEKVLTKIVEDHRKALECCVYGDVIIDISAFSELPSYKDCVTLINKINTTIQSYNTLIQQKIKNPFQSIESTSQNVVVTIMQLVGLLEKLESERIEYNKKVADVRPIIKKLNEINSHITHYDVIDLAAELDKQQREYEEAEKAFNDSKADYDAKRRVVEELEAQRKNVQLALDIINACLKYIFFAEDRLKIDYTDGEYRLYSHGKSVRPCDISVGERNIIGLSYFFASIMEGQEEANAYGKQYLLVIDDPVSSYDAENRIGILSFLKYKLGSFLEGNESTKALVMTHDLMTLYDVHKIFEEIVCSCKEKGYAQAPKFNCLELANGETKIFRYKNRQEYTEILKLIFDYGQGNTDERDLVIGNIMRQALEAFATFQYKKGIEEVSTDSKILVLLPEPEYRSYYENLMYRLVLHGGSHKEEQIKAMKDYDFFSLISEAEKQRTAKDILCFIYLLNEHHVLQHLQEIGNAKAILDTWCEEIKVRAARP